jgi:hypothetical protein
MAQLRIQVVYDFRPVRVLGDGLLDKLRLPGALECRVFQGDYCWQMIVV